MLGKFFKSAQWISLLLAVTFVVGWIRFGRLQAFYDFMAPGVPPKAVCKEPTSQGGLVVMFDTDAGSVNVGDSFDVKLILRNEGGQPLQLSFMKFRLVFPRNVVRGENIVIDGAKFCGISNDPNHSFIDNQQGLLQIYIDQLDKQGCLPIELGPGESLEVADITFKVIDSGQIKLTLLLNGGNESVIWDYRSPNVNLLKQPYEFQIDTQGGTSEANGNGNQVPSGNASVSPTQSTTATGTPPPTGVVGWFHFVGVFFLLLGIVVFYIGALHPMDDKIRIK